MKRIGIISDTHGYLNPQLQSFFEDCDEIWHAGDIGNMEVIRQLSEWKKVRAVSGNIDDKNLQTQFHEYQVIKTEEFNVLLIHIAGRLGVYNKNIKNILKQNPQIDCIVCGHSHILKVQYDKTYKLLYINPGAAGKQGFHQICTALKLEIVLNTVQNIQIIELGKRGEITK